MTRRYRQLARLPAFAHCSGRELRRVMRWGDFVEVQPGQVIARVDHSDWWFFVVVSGRVVVTDPGGGRRELAPGAHFGDAAIVGLRPQPCDAVVAEPSVLFTLGPRYVLSLLPVSTGFRQALLPGVSASDYPAYFRRLHARGQAEWSRLSNRHRVAAGHVPTPRRGSATGLLDLAGPPTPERDRPPGRPLSLADAVQLLAGVPVSAPLTPSRRVWSKRRRRATIAAAAAAVVTVVTCVLLLYHPPRYVVFAGKPIDVTRDISVTGVRTYAPSGHYLLLRVQARQPTLAGYLAAWVRGQPTVDADSGDVADEVRAGRAQYHDSQHVAITLALAAARVDSRRVTVHIVDRGLVGPSAGLVYALALDDLLTPGDASTGRVIAATGELERGGRIEPIGWLSLKAHSAVAGGATLLLVPAAESRDADGTAARVCAVTTLREAMQLVQGSAHANC